MLTLLVQLRKKIKKKEKKRKEKKKGLSDVSLYRASGRMRDHTALG